MALSSYAKTAAIQPSRVHAQSIPRLLNKGCATRASAAANIERINVFDAG